MVEGLSPPRPIDLRNFVATAASSSTATETAMILLTNTCQPSSTPHINAPHPHHRFLFSDTQIHTQTHTRTHAPEREREREKQADIPHFPDLIFVDLYSYPMYATTPHNFQLPQRQQDFFPRKNSASMKTDQPPHFDPQLPPSLTPPDQTNK
jgi:hypothetical protein